MTQQQLTLVSLLLFFLCMLLCVVLPPRNNQQLKCSPHFCTSFAAAAVLRLSASPHGLSQGHQLLDGGICSFVSLKPEFVHSAHHVGYSSIRRQSYIRAKGSTASNPKMPKGEDVFTKGKHPVSPSDTFSAACAITEHSKRTSSKAGSIEGSKASSISALASLPLRALHGISTAREAALQRETGCRNCLDLLLHFLPTKYLSINTVSSTEALRQAATTFSKEKKTDVVQQQTQPLDSSISRSEAFEKSGKLEFGGTNCDSKQQEQTAPDYESPAAVTDPRALQHEQHEQQGEQIPENDEEPPPHLHGGPVSFIGCLERVSLSWCSSVRSGQLYRLHLEVAP